MGRRGNPPPLSICKCGVSGPDSPLHRPARRRYVAAMRHAVLALAIPLALAACGQGRIVENEEYYSDSRRARVQGTLSIGAGPAMSRATASSSSGPTARAAAATTAIRAKATPLSA